MKKFLIETDYFNQPWTWMRRILYVLFALILLTYYEFGEEIAFIKPILISTIIIVFLLKRKDDLMVDKKYLYHKRTSLLSWLTRIDRYEISKIYSIRHAGIHSGTIEILEFLSPVYQGGRANAIEMTFKDDSSKSLSVAIYRKDLDRIIEKVNQLKNVPGNAK